MKHCKFYWISLAATALLAAGCADSISPEDEPLNPPNTTPCTDGTWKCDDNVLSKCEAGNWVLKQTCDANSTCNEQTGTCEPKGDSNCTSGTWKCDKNALSKCEAGNWVLKQTCGVNSTCNDQTGACDPKGDSTCTNGTWKCDKNALSKCEGGEWILKQMCDANSTCNANIGDCIILTPPEIKCQPGEHIFANQCEPDDVNHCGTHTNDCTQITGWKSGSCIDKTCFADACASGYHIASSFDENGNEKTICAADSHDACGSINTQCGIHEICSQGECKNKCQPGEVVCNGSCINPKSNADYCGADATCRSYIPCSEFQYCIDGKCVLSSCQKAEESLCTGIDQNVCVDVHGNNPYHCGACGSTCVDTEIAKTTGCNQGKCTYMCNDNKINCGSSTDPLCLPREQLKTDAMNCGRCNKACEANELCRDGQCILSSCTGNACLYDNACVNLNDHCGTQCTNCNTANHAAAGHCQSGTCVITACATGYHLTTAGTCEIDSTDNCGEHGKSCSVVANASSASCKNGQCIYTCNAGYELSNDACVSTAFVSEWNTTKRYGNNTDYFVRFPIQGREGAIVIDCNGASKIISSGDDDFAIIWCGNATRAVVTVRGKIKQWSCNAFYNGTYTSDKYGVCQGALLGIRSYGKVSFGEYAFKGADRLKSLPENESPKFFNNEMVGLFSGVKDFNQSINHWDTSKITNMSDMFSGASSFNQPLDNWDTSNVTNMGGMFSGASSFNQPLDNWNTSNVTNMEGMFSGASSFNQPLDNWDTSNVTNMKRTFKDAYSFNQPLDNWDTSNVTNMSEMFQTAVNFNQSLDNWDASNVISAENIFQNSGLEEDNYCKLFKGKSKAIWTKYKSILGVPSSYECN